MKVFTILLEINFFSRLWAFHDNYWVFQYYGNCEPIIWKLKVQIYYKLKLQSFKRSSSLLSISHHVKEINPNFSLNLWYFFSKTVEGFCSCDIFSILLPFFLGTRKKTKIVNAVNQDKRPFLLHYYIVLICLWLYYVFIMILSNHVFVQICRAGFVHYLTGSPDLFI